VKPFAGYRARARREVAEALPGLLPRLWRFGHALSGSAEEADELVQATCLRALEKAHQFRPGSRLDSWTFTICRSLWLNELRARRVRRGNGTRPVDEAGLPAPGPDQETNIFASQIVERVMTLPQGQREAVLLVYVEGFTYREAGEIMAIPVGTVMSRLAAARARLAPLAGPEKAGKKGTAATTPPAEPAETAGTAGGDMDAKAGRK